MKLDDEDGRRMHRALGMVQIYRVGKSMVELARRVQVDGREEIVPFAFIVHDEDAKPLARRELGAHGPHAMRSFLGCAGALGVSEADLLRSCCQIGEKTMSGAQMMLALRVEEGGCEMTPPRHPKLKLVS
jgi:hypothetical protein